DSINFALGVERFDVPAFRPHPPGYPVYIALAKISTRAVGVVRPDWDRDRRAAAGLAIISLIAGMIGAWVIARFWMAAGSKAAIRTGAAVLAIASPLFWFTASRPMTDTPGLIAALAIGAAFLQGLSSGRQRDSTLPRAWLIGAFAAGLAIGLRSQT